LVLGRNQDLRLPISPKRCAIPGKPAVICGVSVLYRGEHIAGEVYAGSATGPKASKLLKKAGRWPRIAIWRSIAASMDRCP
jgi:hypothetical protein